MTYGCAAWYIDTGRYAQSKAFQQKLETYQNWFLRQIAGALQPTPIHILRKELCIESILINMQKIRRSTRAVIADSEVGKTIRNARKGVSVNTGLLTRTKGRRKAQKFPDHMVIYDEDAWRLVKSAQSKLGSTADHKAIANAIRAQVRDDANRKTEMIWRAYVKESCEGYPGRETYTASLNSSTGMENVWRYEGLNRQETIALFRMRANVCALLDLRHRMNVRQQPNPSSEVSFC
jgi:hypothetical protein